MFARCVIVHAYVDKACLLVYVTFLRRKVTKSRTGVAPPSTPARPRSERTSAGCVTAPRGRAKPHMFMRGYDDEDYYARFR